MTFATGLKSILRQDPDVILVGEVRDVETARIAVQSALTGHLVFSSVHAIDAVSCALPAARHGHRAVPRHVGDRRRRRATARAAHLHVVRDALRALVRRAGRSTRSSAAHREDVWLHGRGLPVLLGNRLLRPRRRVRGARRSPTRSASASSTASRRNTPATSRSSRVCARCKRKRCGSSSSNVTTMDEVVRNVFVTEGRAMTAQTLPPQAPPSRWQRRRSYTKSGRRRPGTSGSSSSGAQSRPKRS